LIAAHQIPDIVIGTIDPFAKVAGNGIKKLKDAGRNVMVGILETECGELNKRFFTFHQKKRPYIILKWAESRDGFIAPETKQEQKPVWITDEFSRQMAHKWRTEEQAILVGTKTVIDDNPRLNARDWAGTDPVRIVLDQHNRIPKESHIFDNSQKTILISDGKTDDDYKTVIMETIDFERNIADEITTILFRDGIQSVIIEGGRQTLQTFIDAGIWDEARIFKGNIFLGNGTKAPEIKKYFTEKTTLIGDELLIFSNHD
jgi:diaminohydroxyphosphoribosylaminopyrimidine deaminase/5-amino-6-(5-phosphoribosylamino)uracil reductase